MARITTFAAAIAACAFTTTAPAAIVINISEAGPNTIVAFSGSFDLAATDGFVGINANGNFLYPNLPDGGYIAYLPGNFDYYSVSVMPQTFGTIPSANAIFTPIFGEGIGFFADPSLAFPQGYISGDPISGAAIINGQNFAALGLVSGTSFVNTYTNGLNSDTVTINVGPASVIPEPSTYIAAAGLLGLAGFVFIRRQRKNAAAAV